MYATMPLEPAKVFIAAIAYRMPLKTSLLTACNHMPRTHTSSQAGDVFTSPGPDVLTSCGQYGRILQAGSIYVVGIGGPCGSIGEWSTRGKFGERNFDYLRTVTEDYLKDPTTCAALKLLSLPTVLTSLVPLVILALA